MPISFRVIYGVLALSFLANCDAPESVENQRSGAVFETSSQDANAIDSQPVASPRANPDDGDSNPIPTPTAKPTPTPEVIIQTDYRAVDREGSVTLEQLNNGVSVRLLSANQLRNSIATCIAPEMTSIAPQSIISLLENTIDEANTADAFLLPMIYAPGDDIISRNRVLLDGPNTQVVTGTRSASLSLSYLTGLRLIANVVAHNCELTLAEEGSPIAQGCACATFDQAAEMLKRCMPQYNMEDINYTELIEDFAGVCSASRKEAIASLLSSIGFVRIP